MRRLSEDFQARVKVNIESGKISVHASLENYERLRGAIQDLLKEVKENEFDMSWAQRLCQFNEQFITPIARITGTYIEKKDDKTVLLHSFPCALEITDIDLALNFCPGSWLPPRCAAPAPHVF